MDIFEWAEANIVSKQDDILARLSALEKVVAQMPGATVVNDPSRQENVQPAPLVRAIVPQKAEAE